MAREIVLSRGQVAIVDDEDFERLNAFRWLSNGRYAFRKAPDKAGTVHMHREIAGTPDGLFTDHINGNGHDNRRANLRVCTKGENARNRRVLRTSATGFIGVYLLSTTGKYQGRVSLNSRTQHTATFCTAIAAALARDAMTRELHGEFATLNFPDMNIPWEWRPGTGHRAQAGYRAILAKAA